MFVYACRCFKVMFSLALFFAFFDLSSFAGSRTPLKYASSAKNIIYFVPQFSDFEEISIHEMHFLKHILKEAKDNNVKAVIFEIDTPGGRIDVALKYVSILSKSEVPTIAYVNPQGISAGMIVALAADRIAINPNGVIGDAMPLKVFGTTVIPITDKPADKSESDTKKTQTPTKSSSEKSSNTKDESKGKSIKKEVVEKKPKSDSKTSPSLREILKKLEKLDGDRNISSEDKKLAKQKFLTVYFKVLQVLAEKNDRPVRVIRAMADPYQKLSMKEDGIDHVKVSPLTLSAVEAKRLNVVDFVCRSKAMLKDDLGLSDCVMEVKDKTPTHYMIFFLANPLVSGLLIMIGVIGLYIEAKTPGFGFAGGLGIGALALFFIGHMGIGDSNWVPGFIFIVGVVLLALEVFVIPGFTITGVTGILAVFASLLLAFGWDNIELAVNTVGIAIILATVTMVLLTIYVLPESKLMKKMILTTSNSNEEGFSSHDQANEDLLGKEGVVHTTLRPTGVVIIDNRRLDVVTEGDFIEKGECVKVIEIDGMRIVVEKST